MLGAQSANVLNALPKSVQLAARRALAEIRDAEDRAHAEAAIKAFATEFGAKWPKAVAKITDKPDALLCFFDFPAEHWLHLKGLLGLVWVVGARIGVKGGRQAGVADP